MFLTRVPGFGNTTNLNRKRRRRLSTSPGVGRRSRPSLEALETRQLLSTYAVTNTGDNLGIDPQPGAGTGTLRQAIVDADASSSPADIVFHIPASTAPLLDVPVPGFDPVTQTWRIELVTPLPEITNTVSIDGYTEANEGVGMPYLYPAKPDPVYIQSIPNTTDAKDGNNAEERVIIDGSQIPRAPTPTIGFELDASHCLLRGLIISGFNVGVSVPALDSSNNPVVGDLIQGNSIGDYFTYPVDPNTGSPLPSPNTVAFVTGAGNTQQGVVLNSSNTTVGGSNPQENNIICGNGAQGILVQPDTSVQPDNPVQPGASGNQILGNQIGMAGPSINGLYVQDGNGAEGVLIESSGSLAAGFVYASSNFVGSATGGNLISANVGAGVELVGVGAIRNLIQGNYIGVAPGGGYKFGTGDPGNGGDGVLIQDGSQNEIGGTSSALGNTIDSNHGAGIYITGLAAGNVAANNMIGVTADGSQVLGNWSDGVAVYSPSNTIGPGNVISQNLLGIGIYGPAASTSTPGTASDILVVDNLIGTDGTGEQGFGNALEGVLIDNSADNTIQGNASGSQVISGNQVGVELIGAQSTGNLLEGNFIGSDKTGFEDLGNKNEGVLIEGAVNNTIGGTQATSRNLISANHWGVRLDGASATGNVIEGNYIGTDVSGSARLGNEVDGVIVSNSASSNTIGGAIASLGNIIAFQVMSGVLVESGTGDSILSNSIFGNGMLGIDLVILSPPPGPNNLQTAPVLTSAVGGGPSSGIQGTLASIPSTPFLIQFFTSLIPDPSGFGQGQTPIGSTIVTTNGKGIANIPFTPSSSLPANIWVTATATNNLTGDTSEFSNALSAHAGQRAVPDGLHVRRCVGRISPCARGANRQSQRHRRGELCHQQPHGRRRPGLLRSLRNTDLPGGTD